jgi:hypothetical protein
MGTYEAVLVLCYKAITFRRKLCDDPENHLILEIGWKKKRNGKGRAILRLRR